MDEPRAVGRNIRYFFRTSWGSGDTIVAAMNCLANMNVVIVDLRKCMGGNPGTVAMISSYFCEEEPIHLNSLYWRENDLFEQYWTLPFVPGKRLADKPLYILTSKNTRSQAGRSLRTTCKPASVPRWLVRQRQAAHVPVARIVYARILKHSFPTDVPSIPSPTRTGRGVVSSWISPSRRNCPTE